MKTQNSITIVSNKLKSNDELGLFHKIYKVINVIKGINVIKDNNIIEIKYPKIPYFGNESGDGDDPEKQYCIDCGALMIMTKKIDEYDRETGQPVYNWHCKCPNSNFFHTHKRWYMHFRKNENVWVHCPYAEDYY